MLLDESALILLYMENSTIRRPQHFICSVSSNYFAADIEEYNKVGQQWRVLSFFDLEHYSACVRDGSPNGTICIAILLHFFTNGTIGN